MVKGLRERLDEHDENRKSVQGNIEATCKELSEQAKTLEEWLREGLEGAFAKEVGRVQGALSNISQSKCPPENNWKHSRRLRQRLGRSGLASSEKHATFTKK